MTILRTTFAVCILLMAASCGSPPASDNPIVVPTPVVVVQPTSAELPADETGTQLVAKVNGEAISLPEFERALTRKEQEVNAASPDALSSDVLNQLIEDRLIQQGGKAQNIVVTDAEVQAELQSQIEQAGGEAAWAEWLKVNLYTAEEFPQVLKLVLTSNKVRDMLTSDLEGNVKQVHARHILLRTESDAKSILDRLAAGEDFAALAMEYSQDETTRERGGDLGWFTMEELLTPQLAKTAFALQAGEIAGPIATELGYHVLQVIEFADQPVDPERRVYIAQARFENWLQPIQASAAIERFKG